MKKRFFLVLALVLLFSMIVSLGGSVVAAGSMTVVSDTGTEVTEGNVPGASYPHSSVLAWQPYDTDGNTYWDTHITGHAFSSDAAWIWESYRVVHPVRGDVVEFEKEFDIPGNPMGGTIYITCDNGYELSINGTLVGKAQLGTGWQTSNLTESFVQSSGWQTVETWNITSLLVSGTNTIEIGAANEQMDGGTIASNPAGLKYEIDITYEDGGSPVLPDPPLVPGMTEWGMISTIVILVVLIPVTLKCRFFTGR